jgi:hypothetical protein
MATATSPKKITPATSAKPSPVPAPVKASRAAKKSVAAASTTSPKPAPVSPAKTEKKKDKPEKVKVVRDSFTIPKIEYAQLAAMKKRAMGMGLEVKKSELLRAGLALLTATSDAAFRKAVGNVPTLKTGRPGKN